MKLKTLTDALGQSIASLIETPPSLPVIGLSGPQGCGKSTTLSQVLEASPFNIIILGLDDFYWPKAKRESLAIARSPLFETRGPPGTHDLALLNDTLDKLLGTSIHNENAIPKFDKASDDRLPYEQWARFHGTPDAIILEGWMVGATLPPDFLTSPPLNEIEQRDQDGSWRQTQYEQLSGHYVDLWDRIDHFIHIDGPGFHAVRSWRLEQERTTLKLGEHPLSDARRQWVLSFIQHFERLTVAMHQGHRRYGKILKIDETRQLVRE